MAAPRESCTFSRGLSIYGCKDKSAMLNSARAPATLRNDIVIRGMSWKLPRLVPRSAPAVLILLLVATVLGFAAVRHLVNRFNANQQARGRRLYAQGLADVDAGKLNAAVEDFRAALTCDPSNSEYQLSLGRALRDTGDPKRLDEAESYLLALWQRTPQDGTINLALGRVAARRGSVQDALRYYHNAMYGVWNSDADTNRRKARLEFTDFLLQKGARRGTTRSGSAKSFSYQLSGRDSLPR